MIFFRKLFENNLLHFHLIKTQLELGMRVGEICNAKVSWINLREGYISIESSNIWSPKRNSVRIVPINKELKPILKRA